jgi:hypothetical protein
MPTVQMMIGTVDAERTNGRSQRRQNFTPVISHLWSSVLELWFPISPFLANSRVADHSGSCQIAIRNPGNTE